MKIVFVHPYHVNVWECLWAAYLSAYLKQHGYREIEFYQAFFDSDETIMQGCIDADIVGFSCTSPQMKHALSLAGAIKKASRSPHIRIIFGGAHPSSLPFQTANYQEVDQVVVGEGEKAVLDIAKGNRDPIVHMPFIKDLDTLPFPDREQIKQERCIRLAYEDNKIRIASVLSSRGCPHHCIFCSSHRVWGRRWRARSPSNILDEMEEITNYYRLDLIKFADDTFTINRKRVLEFCREMLKRGLDVSWGCNIRADTVDQITLEEMKRAGCEEVWIGVESGSPRILAEMKKGMKLQQIIRCFDIAKEVGLKRRAYLLLGSPTESIRDIRLTEKLCDRIAADMYSFTILAPFPGTEAYHSEFETVDWSKVDNYYNDFWKTKYLNNRDLKREQARLVKKYEAKITFRHRTEKVKGIVEKYGRPR